MFSRRHGPSRLGAAAVTGAAAARLQGRIGVVVVVVRIRMIPRDRETVVSSFSCSRLKGGRGHIELCSLFTVHRSIRGRVSSVYVCIWWYVVRGVYRGVYRRGKLQTGCCLFGFLSLRLTRTGAWYVLQGEGRTDGRTDGHRSVGLSVSSRCERSSCVRVRAASVWGC